MKNIKALIYAGSGGLTFIMAAMCFRYPGEWIPVILLAICTLIFSICHVRKGKE